MKAKQRCRPTLGAHRCVVLYSVLIFVFLSLQGNLKGQKSAELEDFAEVYVDQYFEPDEDLLLSEEGRKKSRALAHYSRGRLFESNGRISEAIRSYKRVLDSQPSQHFLARKTAYLLARSGNNEEAVQLLEKNLKANPEIPFSHIALSEYLATYQGNDPKGRAWALEIIESAAKRFPDEPAVYEHLVRLLIAENRRDDAKLVMEGAAARNNKDPQYWLGIGKIVGRSWAVRPNGPSKDSDLVNQVYAKAFSLAGEDWEVIETVGDFYHATRQFSGAVEAYETVIDSNPDQLVTREKLARVYAAMGEEDKLLETLLGIAEIDTQNATILRQIAAIYIQRRDYAVAVPYFQKALAIAKGTVDEYKAVAGVMIEERQSEAAIDFIKEAAYLFPESPDFPFLLTYPYSFEEQWGEAVKQFEKALKLGEESKPEMFDEAFYFRFAAATERKGNIKRAEKLFQKTIELLSKLNPDEEVQQFTATTYNYLGYMWLENDMNVDEAGELIKTAADLDPESEAIADSLGWFYFKKGDYEKARDELLRAEELMGEPGKEEAEILDHIGRVFYKLGEQEKALEYLGKAVELDPENPEYLSNLEEVQNSGEEKSEAPVREVAPAKSSTPAVLEPVKPSA